MKAKAKELLKAIKKLGLTRMEVLRLTKEQFPIQYQKKQYDVETEVKKAFSKENLNAGGFKFCYEKMPYKVKGQFRFFICQKLLKQRSKDVFYSWFNRGIPYRNAKLIADWLGYDVDFVFPEHGKLRLIKKTI